MDLFNVLGDNMEKIKQLVKKHDNIVLAIVLFIIFLKSFNIFLYNADECWNFSTIYQMTNGYTIYKDLNVIQTPLFFYLIELVFKIFTANFFVFRLCNIVINVVLYLIIYNIYKKIIDNKKSSFLYTLLTFFLCSQTLYMMCNYNSLAILFFMFGILINLDERKSKNFILQGLIIYLVFMTKQNIGVYYVLGLVLNLIFNKHFEKKEIINLIKSVLVFIILFGIYCIYLYVNDNLYNFINYCLMGINEFNRNLIVSYNLLIIIAILILTVFLCLITKKNIDDGKFNTVKNFALTILFVAYPIFNNAHVFLSIIGLVIFITLIVDKILLKDFFNENIKKNIIFLIVIVNICISLVNFFSWCQRVKKQNYDSNPFFGGIAEENEEKWEKNRNKIFMKNIKTITNYIENNNKKTIIFSPYSKIYAIESNYNNGIYDLPLLGNIGKDGEDGLIKQISELKNTDILIAKDESDVMYQESKKAREYIQNNYKKVGEIEQFLIYETD